MTALCASSGTSSPKPGLAEFVAVSSGALALALQRYGSTKLQFLIPLLGLPPLELGPFCATDPPSMPTFTSDEVFSLLRIGLDSDYFSGLAKARDMVSRMLWFDFCQCDAGAQPALTPTVLPVDTPDPVPPAPAVNAACDTYTYTSVPIFNGNTYSAGGPGTFRVKGATSARMTMDTTVATSPGPNVRFRVEQNQRYPSSSLVSSKDYLLSHAFHFVDDFPLVPTADDIQVTLIGETGTGSTNATFTIDIFCGVPPGSSAAPCCAPDTATQSYLDLILKMVTLIQRQAAPFGYVPGATHSALSGHGSFAVSGLVGVAIDVTTLPDSYGRAEGSPEHLFDIGFITLGTADGYELSHRISSDGSLVIPPVAGLFTAVGYTLSPGVVIDLKELLREP